MKIILLTLLLALTPLRALGAAPMIWENSDFGKMLTLKGIHLADGTAIQSLTVDPTTGGGVAAPVGSLGMRDNASSGELWQKVGSGDTVWAKIVRTAGGALTASRAVVTDGSGNLTTSATTATEVGYLSGVTSSVQTQINGKVTANGAITGATKTKITYDAKGLVTAGTDAQSTDIKTPVSGAVTDHTDVYEWISHMWSSGAVEGFGYTDSGTGSISFAAGEIMLRDTSGMFDNLVAYAVNAAGPFTPTDNEVTYYYVDYNGGSPTWASTTTIYDFNGIDKVFVYAVGRRGTRLNVIDWRYINTDADRKERRKWLEWDGYTYSGFYHSNGGAVPSTSGLNLLVSAGKFYYARNPVTNSAFNTSVAGTADANVWQQYYNRAAYVRVADQKTFNNSQYDNAGTLTSLTANRWRADWVYLVAGTTNPYLAVILGDAQYVSQALAQAAPAPATLPHEFEGIAVLIGQITVRQGASTATALSAYGARFSPSAVSDHNTLGGLQGGTTSEYYHLTSAQYSALYSMDSTGGTRQTPTKVQAATTLTYTAGSNQIMHYVCGSNNGTTCNTAVTVSASPVVTDGTVVNKQRLIICGADSTNTVRYNNSVKFVLNGDAVLGKDDCLTMQWAGTDGTNSSWVETGRNF